MKHFILTLLITILLTSCHKNPLPDVSITEPLSLEQLNEIIEFEKNNDPVFGEDKFSEAYPEIRKDVDNLSDVDKARFVKLTYAELGNALKFASDSTLWDKGMKEWEATYASQLVQANALITEWENTYEFQNALQRGEFSTFGRSRPEWAHYCYLKSTDSNHRWQKDEIIIDYIDSSVPRQLSYARDYIIKETSKNHPLAAELMEFF